MVLPRHLHRIACLFMCVHNVEYSVGMYVCTLVASSNFNDCMQAAVVPSFKIIMCMLYVDFYV